MSDSTKLPPLGPYNGQALDALLELEGVNRVDTIVMAIAWPLSCRCRTADFLEGLTTPERVIVLVEKLHTDAYNAGFDGFFTNSWLHCGDVLEALRVIGRDDAAALLERAVSALGVAVGGAHEDVFDALDDEAAEEALDELDDQYTALAWQVTTSLFEFIKENRDRVSIG
ncbi:unnamed protein product [Laminaria digitata]